MSAIRILVIEDTPMNLELVTDLLEAAGHTVLAAHAAAEGIALARRERPDVILMDISLPDMDGLTATRALKADATTRPIPVVALTARAMPGDEANALDAGCVAYLTKPLDSRTFARRIEGFIAHRIGTTENQP